MTVNEQIIAQNAAETVLKMQVHQVLAIAEQVMSHYLIGKNIEKEGVADKPAGFNETLQMLEHILDFAGCRYELKQVNTQQDSM